MEGLSVQTQNISKDFYSLSTDMNCLLMISVIEKELVCQEKQGLNTQWFWVTPLSEGSERY
jgi:hypothetical protein